MFVLLTGGVFATSRGAEPTTGPHELIPGLLTDYTVETVDDAIGDGNAVIGIVASILGPVP